ncbi:MAG: hypothetical protein DLM62_09620 [Pseudonocardiales bacterium]|nr:MAG: hypothetical protein DLM62_09620 [Pseudonocardiales bacterium]
MVIDQVFTPRFSRWPVPGPANTVPPDPEPTPDPGPGPVPNPVPVPPAPDPVPVPPPEPQPVPPGLSVAAGGYAGARITPRTPVERQGVKRR